METLGRQPTDNAEKSLYDFFNSLTLDGVSWFNVDIPGINEIDALSWFKDYRFFAIETKGFKLNDFKNITLDNITYNSQNHQSKYGHKNPPWKQAKNAARILATYLNTLYYQKNIFRTKESKSRNKYIPYIFSLSYFPFISEEEFKNAFPNLYNILSDYILFNDCHLDLRYFESKLKRIGRKHLTNHLQQSKNSFKSSEEDEYNKLISIYNNELVKTYKEKVFILQPESSKSEKYDKSMLKLLESKDLSDELREIDFNFPVFRYGYAGTGKTLIALKILQKFAIENKQVLFSCFNKVLATDLRRFNKLSYEEAYRFFDNITIKDIHELIYEYSPFAKFIGNISINQKDDYLVVH
jgi:SpoVK/Ycf46/Vps4 family AAA+-type ATPase